MIMDKPAFLEIAINTILLMNPSTENVVQVFTKNGIINCRDVVFDHTNNTAKLLNYGIDKGR